ncbi:MAG: glycosyltransferase, partial [Bdellovibrionales bacterium]|nr:glycosyltransferase [Bdellovibrionales bacterium]
AVIRKSEHIVVIAKYWQDYFRELGYTNVHLIYCGYALQDYVCSPQDEQEWRKRFQLNDKKIVYIGNPQVKKGALLAYEALKDSGYELVTSGVKAVEVPCRHLELSFKDYLCLLKAAEVVVLMSQFAEGWNRIAHEAMLMGSPVIGTGYGGMGEVLTGGGQEICTDPKKLPELVQKVISHRSEYSRHGLEYARKFSQEKFEDAWVSLVEKLKAH